MEVVRALLAAGASPHCRDKRGRSPLHWSALEGQAAAAAALLAAGADAAAADARGDTPLHALVDMCQPCKADRYAATARALLEAGAQPGLQNAAGQTPLALAGSRKCAETLRQLMQEAVAAGQARCRQDYEI